MPLQQLAKNLTPPTEIGESSNPLRHHGSPSKPRRQLTPAERAHLLRFFPSDDLEFMLDNEQATIANIIDTALGITNPDNPLTRDDTELPRTVSYSLRLCTSCGNRSPREEMVKCRVCHAWYHNSHFQITDKYDLQGYFWKCITCRRDHSGGPTIDSATREELEEDQHFEDSDNEMPVTDVRFHLI